jgi:hypothetical protein
MCVLVTFGLVGRVRSCLRPVMRRFMAAGPEVFRWKLVPSSGSRLAARLFVRGDELDFGGDEPQDRIVKAFQTLVDKVFVNLTCHETFIQQQLESSPFLIRRSARGEQQARCVAGGDCAAASLLR